ncbi:MAG: hypothetical protein GF398_17955 [Chitinivibrionales bacterium]|nr:hypothetical protein [Chitinivibrionales bacterium]
MKKLILISSLLIFEIGVLIAIFLSIPVSLYVFAIALIFLIVWLVVGKIKPYTKSPYSHMPNWFIYRRSFRIKFATFALVIFGIIFQLDIGFVAVKKTWAGENGVSWITGTAVIGIVFYLIKALVANRKKLLGEDS